MRLLLTLVLLSGVAELSANGQSIHDFEPGFSRDLYPAGIRHGLSSVTIGDLNGDKKPEIIVANSLTNTVSVLLNNGHGSFLKTTSYITGLYPVAVATGDFDSNGCLDVVVVNSGDKTISVLFGSGDGTFFRGDHYEVGNIPCSIVLADFNRDRITDIAVANRYSNTVSILLGKAKGVFANKVDYYAGRLPHSIAASDQNSDGRLDLLITSCFDKTVSILGGKGDGSFQPITSLREAAATWAVSVDLDRDQKADLVTIDRRASTVSVQFGSNLISTINVDHITSAGAWAIAAGDVNKDGILDLAIATSGNYPVYLGSVTILIGKGNGVFEVRESPVTGSGSHSVAIGDLDGDGWLDLAIANSCYDFGGSVSVLYGSGNSTFKNRRHYATGHHLMWIDFGDDDDQPDPQTRWVQKAPELSEESKPKTNN